MGLYAVVLCSSSLARACMVSASSWGIPFSRSDSSVELERLPRSGMTGLVSPVGCRHNSPNIPIWSGPTWRGVCGTGLIRRPNCPLGTVVGLALTASTSPQLEL